MYQLELSKEFAVSVEQLYGAWSSAEQLSRWFAPGDMVVPEAQCDFRIGGHYRIIMREPGGAEYIVGGEYLALESNRLIRFSWCWEHVEETSEVQIEFSRLDDERSILTLIHSGFAEQDNRDEHGKGWGGCLQNLQAFIEQE